MTRVFRSMGACFLGSLLSLFLNTPARAANVVGQAPCIYTDGRCVLFGSITTPIPVIRSFTFNMPAAGKALVRFDGTMQCSVDSTTPGENVIDLATQIVTNAATVPNPQGLGGAKHAMRIHHRILGEEGFSASVNLAASRVIAYATGGNKTVHFKITQLRMDPGTSCQVVSAAFAVVTFP